MTIVMPTSNMHTRAAEASAILLDRYWPDHPSLHVIHHDRKPKIDGAHLHNAGPQNRVSWLEAVTSFVHTITDETFLLLLDDYGLCAAPKTAAIAELNRVLGADATAGIAPLSWYPARERTQSGTHFVKLAGFPIMLQAAIWRRDWFLSLAADVNPKCSPWGFEALATQAAKRLPRKAHSADIQASCSTGRLIDGMDKSAWPLPYHNLMHAGQWDETHIGFLIEHGISVPSRGLGDTIAKVTTAIGINPCGGCKERQEQLNAMAPYKTNADA